MVSAFNNHFPEKRQIFKACTKFYGIGNKMAIQALDRAGITKNRHLGKVSASQLSRVKAIVEFSYDVDNELRFKVKSSIARKKAISSYKGVRHSLGLPCRGQRTRSNARTCRRLQHATKQHTKKSRK